jgi:hypothetical protein
VVTTVLTDCTLFFSQMAVELGAHFLVFDRIVSDIMRECGIASAYYSAVIMAIRLVRVYVCVYVCDRMWMSRRRLTSVLPRCTLRVCMCVLLFIIIC